MLGEAGWFLFVVSLLRGAGIGLDRGLGVSAEVECCGVCRYEECLKWRGELEIFMKLYLRRVAFSDALHQVVMEGLQGWSAPLTNERPRSSSATFNWI